MIQTLHPKSYINHRKTRTKTVMKLNSLYPTYGTCKKPVLKKSVLHINPAHYKNNKKQVCGVKRIKIYAIRTQAL